MKDANRNQLWARAFTEELVRAGVRTVCIAPGSRSTPLVLACARVEGLRVLTHLDERSAAYFALGLGKATGRPAAVVTTSGTATANLFPAVVEASQAEVPLLLLTADRPHRLRDADANQSIDQIRLYGEHVRAFVEVAPPTVEDRALRHLRSVAGRAVASAVGMPAGPVHLNFPFDKPLEPTPVVGDVDAGFYDEHPLAAEGRAEGEAFARIGTRRPEAEAAEIEAVAVLLQGSERGLVVAGPSTEPGRTGPAAVRLSAASGFPLLADPLSGARYGPAGDALVSGRYDLFLRDPEVRERLRPEVVLRIGSAPTSAALNTYLEEALDARQIVIDAGGRWKDHLSVANDYVQADPTQVLDVLGAAVPRVASDEWRSLWSRAEERADRTVTAELEAGEVFEGELMADVVDVLPGGSALFVSSSMPVRDLDAYAPPREAALRTFGNRGASGIDGIVSTALGVSVGLERPVVAVVGDLAFYHDMNGLLGTRIDGAEVVFVLVNNDGGGIFHMLPIREHEPAFTSLFATPHGLDFRHAAALYDLPYRRVGIGMELRSAVADALAEGGSRILEVRSDRETNHARHEETARAVRDAIRDELTNQGEAG